MSRRKLVLLAAGLFAAGSPLVAPTLPADVLPDAGGVFERGPELNVSRQGAWCSRLPDGRLAVFGGQTDGWDVLDTAEVLETDGTTGEQSWRTLTMRQERGQSMGVWLADGRLLLIGGTTDGGGWPGYTACEIYDPTDDSFTFTGSMTYGRAASAAVRLANGKVMVVGTWWGAGAGSTYAEVYDPAAGTFSMAGALVHPRSSPLALACDDGTAVVIGGGSPDVTTNIESVESFDPVTGQFTEVAGTILPGEQGWSIWTHAGMWQHPLDQDNRLADGRILLMLYGQGTPYRYRLATFDPATKQFAGVGAIDLLHDSDLGWYLHPVVDAQGKFAMLLNLSASVASQVQIETVALAPVALQRPTGWYDVGPGPYFSAGSVMRDARGRFVVAGGRTQASNGNYSSTRETLFITPNALVATEPPEPPADLAVTATTGRSIRIEWTDRSDDEDGFRIERAPAVGAFAPVAETSPGVQTFVDDGLDIGTTYLYRVCAYNAAGDSPFASDVTTTTAAGRSKAPKQVSFGTVRVGKTRVKNVVVQNTGRDEPLWVRCTLGAGPFSLGDSVTEMLIPPRKKLVVSVTFAPPAAGKIETTLVLETSDDRNEQRVVVLSGKGK